MTKRTRIKDHVHDYKRIMLMTTTKTTTMTTTMTTMRRMTTRRKRRGQGSRRGGWLWIIMNKEQVEGNESERVEGRGSVWSNLLVLLPSLLIGIGSKLWMTGDKNEQWYMSRWTWHEMTHSLKDFMQAMWCRIFSININKQRDESSWFWGLPTY